LHAEHAFSAHVTYCKQNNDSPWSRSYTATRKILGWHPVGYETAKRDKTKQMLLRG
jgi:hypothetical protein